MVAAPKACRTVYAAAGELRRFDVAYTSALTACRLADSQMCTLAYNDTPYVTVEQRLEVLRLGCEEGGDPAMCHEYGVQLSVGDLLPKDEATGRTYSVRACDAGSVDACNSLAETLLADRRTEAEALPFLEKACTAGSTRSCTRAKALGGSGTPSSRQE